MWGGPDSEPLPDVAGRIFATEPMRLDTEGRLPRLFFTEPGLAALHAMMMDRRFADPGKFAHIRQELGIDPAPDDT